jgi:hypothetical protein
MANDFTREFSPEVNAAIANAQSTEEIRTIMMRALEQQGLAEKDRSGNYSQTHAAQSGFAPSAPSQQPATSLLRRIINVGGSPFVISETSEEKLDRLEQALKGI